METGCLKFRLRVARVIRHQDRHDLRDISLEIQVEGDLALKTSTVRTVVYAQAKDPAFADLESFGALLGQAILDHCRHVTRVIIDLSEPTLHRHGRFSFEAGSAYRRTSRVTTTRDRKIIESGVTGLSLLKTAESSIIAVSLDASWHYRADETSWTPNWHGVIKLIADTFAEHTGATLLQSIGETVLAQCEHLAQIRLIMKSRRYPPAEDPEVLCPEEDPQEQLEVIIAR
jgi:urate oxidase